MAPANHVVDLSLGPSHCSHADLPAHPLLQVQMHTCSFSHILVLIFASYPLTHVQTHLASRLG